MANFKPQEYHESAEFLKSKIPFVPEALLILGSGLGFLADELENAITIPYGEIPHFKNSTAPGHKGRLVAGKLSGKNVLAMQGRFHIYEGYSPEEAAYPVRVASLLGAGSAIITCACGGVNKDYNVGDLALLTDYVNLTHPGPLVGFDISGFDARFFDMGSAYDKNYRALAKTIAEEKGITLREGVYFYMPGPQFETPAEIRAIRALGGDLVGMSVVHETIMARRCNMRTLGLGLVTNMAAGILDAPLTEDEVLVEGQKAAKKFSELIKTFVSTAL
ncbi:MAG: purine-nucleoside phosphorylase [Defluviitaleaceae bacterium]|nr:purine-nucleoside phosphorylase [Defluviitaleaceae bacterium]